MNSISALIPISMVAIVILGWVIFCAIFLLRKKPPKTEDQKRDRTSIMGIVLQALAYTLVWSIRRPLFTAIGAIGTMLSIVLGIATLILMVGSIWLVTTAVRTLGKQWSLAARLVKGHQLIIEGPYQIVRHPIYTGMMGMLIATGLAISHWLVIVVALILFIYGTMIRVKIEERLLRAEFGQSYEDYATRVPRLFPLIRGG